MAMLKKSATKGPGDNFPVTDEHRAKAKSDTYRLKLFGGDVEKAAQSIAAGMNFVNVGEGANKKLVLMNPTASFNKSYGSTSDLSASGIVGYMPNSSGTGFEMVNVSSDGKMIRKVDGGSGMAKSSTYTGTLTGDDVLNSMTTLLRGKGQEIQTAAEKGGEIKTSRGVINIPAPGTEDRGKGQTPVNPKTPAMKKKK
jgi:hypothetical protein